MQNASSDLVCTLKVCPAQAITIEAEEREDGARRTTRYFFERTFHLHYHHHQPHQQLVQYLIVFAQHCNVELCIYCSQEKPEYIS